MAVTSTFKRTKHSVTVPIYDEVCAATFTGTYVANGFTWKPFTIVGGPGSSPLPASAVLAVDFYSPLGYIYATSVATDGTATTVIYSAPGTEFTPGAVPDAACTVVIKKAR